MLTLWLTVVIIYYVPFLNDEVGDWTYLYISICVLFWLVLVCICVPNIILKYSLTTKIEMFKDRKIIEEVIRIEKSARALRIMRIYRQLKSIHRDLKRNLNLKKLDKSADKLAEEIFFLESNNEQIHVTQLDRVLDHLGIRLSEDELRLLAKECDPNYDNYITYKNFKQALEKFNFSRLYKPQEVVIEVFKEYFKQSKSQKLTNLNLGHVNEFLKEYNWHFNEQDIREFLKDLKYYAGSSGKFTIEELGGFIRDEISILPK